MIKFNENDYNLSRIKKDSKLSNLNTIFNYRVYGLKNIHENPIIFISVGEIIWEETEKYSKFLANFFLKNKLYFECEAISHLSKCDDFGCGDRDCNKEIIKIGLRADLRKHIILSSAILQTIIYTYEKRLSLRTNMNIPGIPKFKNCPQTLTY